MSEEINYRIIEGAYIDIDYEEFKKDYMDISVPKADILEKYDLTHNRYLKYGNQVYEETGFKRKRGVRPMSSRTHIREYNGRYRIDKEINGRKIYIGTFKTMEDARRARDYLVKHNWTTMAIDFVRSNRL